MIRVFRVNLLFYIVVMITASAFGQTAKTPDARSLARVFHDALRNNLQPGGSVVSIANCASTDPGDVSVSLPKAKTRLMQIALANPDYTVSNTEVPNFLPVNYEPPLLTQRIPKYMLDSNNSPRDTFARLLVLKELQPAIEESGLHRGLEIISGAQPPPWKPEVPRRKKVLESLTLREALNEMAAFYGTGKWAYLEVKNCNGEILTRIHFTIY